MADLSLYAGSARYYARGRLPYPPALAEVLRDELGLDGTGRLLDVGCGPGSLTRLLAPLVAEAVGIDADAEMVAEARRLGLPNARFVQLRAEELPAGLGTFRVLCAAQSFHWLDPGIARTFHAILEPGGSFVHVGATTHEGEGNVPRAEIAALIERWAGPRPATRRDERELVERDGFVNRRELDAGWEEPVFERSEDEIVASVFSLSYAAPHRFAGRADEFEAELRALLRGRGPFHERARPVTATVWDRPA